MLDLTDQVHLARLRQSVSHSYKNLRHHRANRTRLIEDYVGSQYNSWGGQSRKTYVNLMFQTADTYTQVLAAQRPQVLVSTHFDQLLWFASHFQQSINNLIDEIHLDDTMQMCVLDAFFGIGICKVYTAESGVEVLVDEDTRVDPGKPFAEHISLDDWVHDVSATSWPKARFLGDRYRVTYDAVKQSDMFDSKAVKAIWPTIEAKASRRDGEPLAADITKMDPTPTDDLEPMVDLWDLYLPAEKQIVTIVHEGDGLPPLRVVPWDGPENGPYHTLTFADVPDNAMPVAPGTMLRALADLVNANWRKLASQARRQKENTFYTPGNEGGADRYRQAGDGEVLSVEDPSQIVNVKTGGVDPGNQQFTMHVVDMFDRMSGNLSMMAGLGPQSDTLGQDKIIHAAVSRREQKMQTRVMKFAADICRDLGWLLWNDPVQEIDYSMEIPNAGVTLRGRWTPELREGDFLQYNLQIEPYSMQYKSPSERMRGIVEYVQNIAAPLAPFMQQMGGYVDLQALTELYAELMNLPRLKQVIKFQAPSQTEANKPGPAGGGRSAAREYVHKSVPSGSGGSERQAEMQSLLQQASDNDVQTMRPGANGR